MMTGGRWIVLERLQWNGKGEYGRSRAWALFAPTLAEGSLILSVRVDRATLGQTFDR